MVKIGVAGNSASFYDEGHVSTAEAAAWCRAKGLDLFEYSFGKGINLSDETAGKIGDEFKKHNMEISVHAPYFINFANTNEDAINKSFSYVMRSAAKLKSFGCGDRVVFHPAAQGKSERKDAVTRTTANIKKLGELLTDTDCRDYKICIETMGKLGQLGSLEEVIEFCSAGDNFYPCLDFGHLNARTRGGIKTVEDYEDIIEKLSDGMPRRKVDCMHIHFSKVMYGNGGEIRHLTFADDFYGPDFEQLAEVLVKYDLHPHIICESSGTQAEDAVKMIEIYKKTLKKISNL